MSVNRNITEKNYRKLSIQVSLDGFCYCVFDTLNNRIDFVNEVLFSSYPKMNKVEDYLWRAFLDHKELTRMYDEVVVVHVNNLNSFVPKALFDEEYCGSYLQFNTKVFESDFYAFDGILSYEMNNVYIPYVNINNYLLDQFECFDYRHVNSILVEKLLDLSRNVDEKLVFVHFGSNTFEIVVVENRRLLFFNSFDFQSKEDFIYYLLFTAEQLGLNPESFKLQLLGCIDEDSALFKIAYRYVRHVALLDVSGLQQKNFFSTAQNLKHFILFQS